MKPKSISRYVFLWDIALALGAALFWGAVGSMGGQTWAIVGAVIGFISAMFSLLLFQGRSQS